jgi:hypothetical protein
MAISLEGAFILEALRAYARGARGVMPLPHMDWRVLGMKSARMRVGPLLLETLNAAGVPPEILRNWHAERQVTFVRNARAADAAVRLSRLLDTAHFAHAYLRGLVTGHTLYHDPSLRVMTDVDLLVPERSVEDIRAHLAANDIHPDARLRRQLGYTLNGIVFEMHWSLTTVRRFRDVGKTDCLLETRLPLALPGGDISRLPHGPELGAAIAHGLLHHGLNDPRHVLDIGLLMAASDVDWAWLATWSRGARFSRATGFVLHLANVLLDLHLDATLRAHFPEQKAVPAPVLDAYTADLLGEGTRRERIAKQVSLIGMAEGFWTKVGQCVRGLSAEGIWVAPKP